jgi:phospholipid transport system substrate-binding protein
MYGTGVAEACLRRITLVVLGRCLPIVRLLPVAMLGYVAPAHAEGARAAPSDPVATIRSFDRRLRRALRRHVPDWSPEAEMVQMELHDLVDDTVSIGELARGTLGGHWAEATDPQRTAFVGLFRQLLIKRLATGQLLAFAPEAPPQLIVEANGAADVRLVVRQGEASDSGARRASIDYRLRFLDGRWQLVDLLMDGQSVVGQYREQFDRIIARERFEGLLARMRRNLA